MEEKGGGRRKKMENGFSTDSTRELGIKNADNQCVDIMVYARRIERIADGP